MSSVAFDQPLTPSPDAMVRVVGDESVVLDMASGRYLGMNSVGTRIWELLSEGKSPNATVNHLVTEFDVTEEVLRNDVGNFVGRLVELGLVSS